MAEPGSPSTSRPRRSPGGARIVLPPRPSAGGPPRGPRGAVGDPDERHRRRLGRDGALAARRDAFRLPRSCRPARRWASSRGCARERASGAVALPLGPNLHLSREKLLAAGSRSFASIGTSAAAPPSRPISRSTRHAAWRAPRDRSPRLLPLGLTAAPRCRHGVGLRGRPSRRLERCRGPVPPRRRGSDPADVLVGYTTSSSSSSSSEFGTCRESAARLDALGRRTLPPEGTRGLATAPEPDGIEHTFILAIGP